MAKFVHARDNCEPITGQPSDTGLIRLLEDIAPPLLHIPYGERAERTIFIRPKAAYVARYGKAFPEPKRVGAYDPDIDDNTKAVVRARLEAAHKAKGADHATFETARRETTQFVLAVVTNTRVCELRDTDSLYTEVGPEDLFAPMQVGCTGRHDLELLFLHNKMQR